ncbi:FAD-dependent oxidoreductase [Fulvimonas sp. R45]|uniref:NAD(P)/FAD-dependent oxidoreductase n=1 Tax=Fulvimonas sp. R45 TaxID=3045937 RepID=UPI00265FA53D|nr:FAD-dependent oxidoreductase [Fulvimonas sp. R45]MDO1529359.1 FAD-dependent oxidoreductase [Fulvimonas sp. R45]
MNGYDLIVVGAGIVGACCADEAAAAGLRVAIVEPATVGGGATACAMGHLVAMDDDPAELALARLSLQAWEAFSELPEAEFSRCGTLWVAASADEAAGIAARVARINASGGEAHALDAQQLREVEPALAPDLCAGMLAPREAVVYPPRMAQHLVRRACARGAALHRRAVQRLGRGGAVLDDGSVLRGPVLVATGCALPRLLPQLPLRPRKGHLVITDRYPGQLRHQVLELGYADSAHGSDGSSVAFNVQPRPTGQVLVGSSREFDVDDAAVSPPMLARMLQRAFRFMPALRELQAIRAWTGFRPATPDGRPYLGAVPGHADLWVAAGHEGLGVTTAPGSARLLLDLILGRTPAIDPAPYAPSRVLP